MINLGPRTRGPSGSTTKKLIILFFFPNRDWRMLTNGQVPEH